MPAETVQDNLFDSRQPAYTIRTESFEGPLDLLLSLIKKNEVDIYNIPIASITRQYLDYIDLLKELNLDIAGEFLVMASTLIQIKSKMLLPVSVDEESGEEEEEDPRAELVRRLIEYQKYKEAATTLGTREILGRDTFARKFEAPDLSSLKSDGEPHEVELFELIEAFRRVLATVPRDSFHEVTAEGVSIADRINEILSLLEGKDAITFDDIFAGTATVDFLIASFLALLELCKLRTVKLVQATSFGTIWIMPAVQGWDTVTGEDDASGEP